MFPNRSAASLASRMAAVASSPARTVRPTVAKNDRSGMARTEAAATDERAVAPPPAAAVAAPAIETAAIDTTAQAASPAIAQPLAPPPSLPAAMAVPAATSSNGSAMASLVGGTATGVGGVRTVEDIVAELLRPMLREWLAENMPRIVEKALRIELAEGLKTVEHTPQARPKG
ncbi:MAG: DUF2497 domain-containing protein [Hyphomicrobiaceae bacterium]|nr:DUF2497 domain-containing protein [Hyphomicrobiaceae bacterium]